MIKHETVEKCVNAIMELKGADELKEAVKRLQVFLKNKESNSLSDVTLPNYLWVAKRGGGITTLVNAFTDYLYAAKAIEFCGTAKSFEFKLDYIAPETYFSELSRFYNMISNLAGHNRFYKGIICINIDEWLEHISEGHFAKFLNYIANNNDKILTVFCIHTDARNVIESVESFISSYIRLETLTLQFPDSKELVEFMESQYMQKKGFSLLECAKKLLGETIVEIATGKQFNGFKSIIQLADDILYKIHTMDLGNNKSISAEMLSCYSKDSNYVQRVKARIGTNKIIGFTDERSK